MCKVGFKFCGVLSAQTWTFKSLSLPMTLHSGVVYKENMIGQVQSPVGRYPTTCIGQTKKN